MCLLFFFFQITVEEDESNAFFLVVTQNNLQTLQKSMTLEIETGELELIVKFLPNAIGAFRGKLVIRQIEFTDRAECKLMTPVTVLMLAYGGLVLVQWSLNDLGPDSDMVFVVGKKINTQDLTQTIVLQNCGELPAFIYVAFDSLSLPFSLEMNIKGRAFVIKPQEKHTVTVNFVMRHDLLRYFKSNKGVRGVHVGVLKLYWGSEVLRCRLRRVVDQAEESECQAIPLPVVETLSQKFANEDSFPEDVDNLLDQADNIDQLLQSVRKNSIPVIVRRKH